MAAPREISRVTRSKSQALAAYDQLSRWYDWLSASSEWPLAEIGLRRLKIASGEAVLEIGSGTGSALLALANAAGVSGKVVGVDLSRGMFKVASQKLIHANLSQRVALTQGDAAALPFAPNSFTSTFISFTLELFDTPEIPIVLGECYRVLKPGGRIAAVAMVREINENIPVRIYEWFHHHLPAYVDCRPIYLQPALVQAGLQIQETIYKKMWGLPVEICIAKKE